MEIDIIEAGALVKLPSGHNERQRILRIIKEIADRCKYDVRRVRGRILIRYPEQYTDIWPALGSALEDHKSQMRMF